MAKKGKLKNSVTDTINFSSHLPARIGKISSKLVNYASATCQKHLGMGIREWRILAVLVSQGPLSINEIAEYHGTVQSSVSRAVQSLERRKMVKRTKSKTDARQFVVTLTKKGVKAHDTIVPVSLNRAEELMESLTPTEQKQLDNLLIKLENKVDEIVSTDLDDKFFT